MGKPIKPSLGPLERVEIDGAIDNVYLIDRDPGSSRVKRPQIPPQGGKASFAGCFKTVPWDETLWSMITRFAQPLSNKRVSRKTWTDGAGEN
jgi:hypothetical protein